MAVSSYKADLNSCLKYVSINILGSTCTQLYTGFASFTPVTFLRVAKQTVPLSH